MTLRPICAIAAYALSLSCSFSMHASGSGLFGHGAGGPPPPPPTTGGEPEATPSEPAANTPPARVVDNTPATPATPSKGPSKRGPSAAAPGNPAPVPSGLPVYGLPEPARGPAATAAFNGTYVAESKPECSDVTPFDPKGPDVQTIHEAGWGYQPGFRCPASCTNTAPVTITKGKASLALVWVEDHPPADGDGYKVTMHRYRFEIPLNQFADKSGYAGGATVSSPPFRWSHNNIYEMQSDSFAARIAVADIKDVHWGTGRAAVVTVPLRAAGSTDATAYEEDAEAACKLTLLRTDWKPGDGLADDDGGDDGGDGDASSTSSSSSSSHDNGGAARKCKSSCRQDAGACRTACHGSSAKCASDCNHEESACQRGC